MTTAARPGQFTGATDNAANGGLFTDSKIDGIPDLVAADVASAQTSATNAAASAATAATQATTSTTKATEAATSATAAATSATAAATSATAASSSATTASNAVSSVSTNATNAATSATNAAASASTASTQATNATTQANSALSSASAANTSASNASTSATNASNSATAAATSATNAANTLDSFDDRYLGVKSSDPSADNDGDSLATGALYFKTGDGLKVYNGSAWEDIKPTASQQTNINTVAGIFDGTQTFAVTVANVGGVNVFVIDGANNPALSLVKGFTYTFDVSDNTNSGHPLRFKDASGNSFSTGVTVNGTQGQSGATVVLSVPETGTQPARYYCTVHGNAMGNAITTQVNEIATVAGISSEVQTVAGKASLITSDFVSDLNTLATSDIVSDLNTLATADIVSDLNTLATSSNVSNMSTLSASGVVGNIATVAGVSSNVSTVAGIASNITTVANDASDIGTVASNISNVNNFASRYRIASSDPSSSLDEGDLAYNSTANVLKYYNGSAWVEVAANTKGIANGNVAEFTTGVADDDFLRISGTKVEGRSASEVLTDIGGTTAAAAADESTALAIALG